MTIARIDPGEVDLRVQPLITCYGNNKMSSGALLSSCGTWRYRLERYWNPRLPTVPWICLNPSTADAEKDDATVRKIAGFSARLGYGGFVLFNVLAWRATDQKELLAAFNPVGPGNEPWRIAEACEKIGHCAHTPAIVAWGDVHKKFRREALEVVRCLQIVRCFGLTKSGQPLHPSRLPYTTKMLTLDPSHFFYEGWDEDRGWCA